MSFLAAFFYRQFLHNPPVPTKSYKGRTVIVTGSSSGLGLEACRTMVRLGASQVILACRNLAKAEAAAKDIRSSTSCSSDTVKVWHLDMSSYDSVQKFANKVTAELPRLDALIANAGLGTRTFKVTEDNEESITTMVVSLFLLVFLLYPKLQETAVKHNTDTHVTVTASELYEVAKFQERKVPAGQIFSTLNNEKTANMNDRYNVSKLLQILMIKQMAAMAPFEHHKVILNCVAPGLCHSDLHRDIESYLIARVLLWIFCRPTEVGARTLVYGASAGKETHGQYLPDCKLTKTGGLCEGAAGAELQKRVWLELQQKLEAIKKGVTALPS